MEHVLKTRLSKIQKSGRNGWQITGVGLWALALMILYYLFDVKLFYSLFFVALAEQFSDSLASDIGSLTKKRNIDIITFKPVEKGLSGGVSLLGTFCAFFGAFAILLVPLMFGSTNIKQYLILSLIAFTGALIDSVLGSWVQVLYQCEKCGVKTEQKEHCDLSTKVIKGKTYIDNVMVNLISGLITCIIGGAVLLI